MANDLLVLSYSGCSTCKKALKWLEAQGLAPRVRPIVEQPPTLAELDAWIAKSGLPVRKWLNTSGLSYRALGKAKVDAASEADVRAWLAADGKLVKRPVLVTPSAVVVGFQEEAWERVFAKRG
ncbi:Spx/MgsR family RNA polymerase-binding regulatory protein [Myxococcus sp. K38C18041901]|uniref:Spx/MgsR family RNA polymerase-binding regulatory protein n=1 Tax=Myxococcus guangdongensis TaxID=2906760 RepID=UPI0020A725EF|nr:Spx/MgsR family RNA polymerase-binding regulatory protein [Myxococcus guangdongensis]MCP3057871.1 Spx/MgsR family RNA polymerase-binding regulatory protein [Myxococcus guangdongensis]